MFVYAVLRYNLWRLHLSPLEEGKQKRKQYRESIFVHWTDDIVQISLVLPIGGSKHKLQIQIPLLNRLTSYLKVGNLLLCIPLLYCS